MAIEGPGHDPDVDEEFARIVAGWDDVATTSGSALLPPSAPAEEPLMDQPAEAPTAGSASAPLLPPAGVPPPPGHSQPPTEPPRPQLRAETPRPQQPDTSPHNSTEEPQPEQPANSPDNSAEQPDGHGPPDADVDSQASADDPASAETDLEHDAAWREWVPEEPEEHFEPPEPQLPPAHDATYWLAVVGLVAGPLLVLWAVVLSSNPDPGWLIVAGIIITIGGFGLLVMRGSGDRDPDDDGSRV